MYLIYLFQSIAVRSKAFVFSSLNITELKISFFLPAKTTASFVLANVHQRFAGRPAVFSNADFIFSLPNRLAPQEF